MRVAFMGTPDFAAASLRELFASSHDVVAVVSQPDRPSGRGRKVLPTPVAALARQHDCPLDQSNTVATRAFREWLSAHTPDVVVVAAFGKILGPKLLSLAPLGCINVHGSLLPRWRGASPIQSALLAGDSESGVCIMEMVSELDAGAVLDRVSTPIRPKDTSSTLHDRLAALGATLLVKVLDRMERGPVRAEPQPMEGVTFAPQFTKADGNIDWSESADSIARRLRAFSPWPGCRTQHERRGEWLKLHPPALVLLPQSSSSGDMPGTVVCADPQGVDVVCGDGAILRLTSLQAPGKRVLEARSFLAGYPLNVGDRLT